MNNPPMMALSLWQPWASLIAAGAKPEETRSWRTNYRGRLAIHAATRPPADPGPEFRAAAQRILHCQLEDLPRGGIVAIASLAEILRTEDVRRAPCEARWGDYSPGRYVWVLTDVRAIVPSHRVRGEQRLWQLPEALAAALEARAGA